MAFLYAASGPVMLNKRLLTDLMSFCEFESKTFYDFILRSRN
jgi:hypothetical protein